MMCQNICSPFSVPGLSVWWQRAEMYWCLSSSLTWAVSAAGLLNLTYDAMPQEYVTVVMTEFGAIPPTSVPVILREYRQEPVS